MKHGFSLVELSIVLVILGLLTGGILAGQSLIRASELRAVTTEFQRYATAAQTFRDKYFAIPGDFNAATRFWLHQTGAGCVNSTGAAANTATGVCDGNGDGLMNNAAAVSEAGENLQYWRHLANAGLIEGTYSGFAGAGHINEHIIGINSPRSRISNGGWTANYSNLVGVAHAEVYGVDLGNFLLTGGQRTASTTSAVAFRPEEAWNIDTKMDDGKPALGKVIARYWNNLCSAADDGTHTNDDLAASYRLTDNTLQCALHFIKAF